MDRRRPAPKLLGDTEHDLLFLAGHFSANDTLAADFTTTLRPRSSTGRRGHRPPTANAGKLTDALVLSAGCHSGYTIVDGEAADDRTATTGPQAMAQQQAVLLGGTGYQYGDTEFLEYSERLYLNVARSCAAARDRVAIGEALTAAKRDYLASLVQVTGIDQKSVLQATMYGLPMTRLDLPGRARPPSGWPTGASRRTGSPRTPAARST